MVTSAMVLVDSDGNILGCHAYGKPADSGYDFPKGLVDEGETDFEAACRELKEETGLTIGHLRENGLLVLPQPVDCGVYKHNREKMIHLFVCPLKRIPTEGLKCDSYFELYGKKFPEVDGYRVVPKSERSVFNKVLWNKFGIIDEVVSDVKF